MTKLPMMLITLLLTQFVYGAGSGPMGGDMPSSGTQETRKTPMQMAVSSYNAGLNHKKRAQQYEDKAAVAQNDKDREKQLSKAQSQYKDAIEDYKKAIGYDNTAYEAMNELGYAYRKSGDYDNAVRAYNAALTVKPGFAPAIEYRGEAYLAQSRFKDVQEAYLELVRTDADQAAALMIAMEAWQELHATNATGEAKEFAQWVQERKAVAANTLSLSTNNVHSWN
ncbi:MAG TPA: tetratricopeptide repeat protein [Pseudomonadales bacterium]